MSDTLAMPLERMNALEGLRAAGTVMITDTADFSGEKLSLATREGLSINKLIRDCLLQAI
jgi:hypothetical protein